MFGLRGKLYQVILLCLLCILQQVFPDNYYPTIFWTPNNCRFNLNKPGNGNPFYFKVKPGSHLFFVCPNIAIWQDMSNKSLHRGRMYDNLMLVDEEGYKTCTVNKKKNPKLNREIFRCNEDPTKFKFTEEIFASNRAFADKMKYTCGKTYYFISTSDGTMNSLNNTNGGHCKTHHMKMKIYICNEDEPCDFEMPKCPFTKVFDGQVKKTTTTKPTTTTNKPASNPTLSTRSNIAKYTTDRNAKIISERIVETQKGKKETETKIEPTTVGTGRVDARKQQTNTIFGDNRKHIIIHITMSLIVLILLLCLIYIYVARRNPSSHSQKPKGVDSELYRTRPMSLQPIESEPLGAPV